MLFPKEAEGFDELVYIVRFNEFYNRNVAEGLDRMAALTPEGDSQKSDKPFDLNLTISRRLSGKTAKHKLSCLVDMAKVGALDTMEEGRNAAELLDQHV